MKDIFRQVAVLLSTVAVIVVNGLANALPLNGQTSAEIANRLPIYFVPAGYVFSIWGLIYLGLLAYSIYQVLPSQRQNPRLRRIGWLYVLSCLANIAWLFLWHYEFFELTAVAMAALLLLLIAVYLALGTGRTRVSPAETWLVRVPFSIYLGWITVATIANVTSLLDYLKWSGWGISPDLWAVIMLIVATIIASAVSLSRGDVAYALVIIWAFVGIAVKHSATTNVAVTAWVAVAVVALTLLVGILVQMDRMRNRVVEDVGIRDRW